MPPSKPIRPRAAARRSVLMGLALVPGAAFVALGGAAAWAQAPSQVGWWTQANPGSVGGSPTPPSPPDVPAGGMLIEGGMSSSSGASDSGPGAFGALVYAVPYGQSPATLTLAVAAGSGTTPAATLELCPLSSRAVDAEQGGPMSDAPGFSCATDVVAQPSPSGDSYSFDVSTLAAGGALAVAVLPTSPTDRVVLDKPGAASLSERPSGSGVGSAAAGAGSGGSGAGAGTGSQPGAPSGGGGTAPAPGAPGSGDSSSQSATLADPSASLTPASAGSLPAASAPQAPEVPQAAASTSPPRGTTGSTSGSTGSSGLASTPTSSDTGGPRAAAVAALVVGFLIGGTIWLSAGRAAARAAARRMTP